MSDAALARFVFSPGFSTATRITPVSGRGVGMDAVKTCIERIGGRIEVASAEGRGTSFRMILP
jgi:two-component system chemotaxis sensor kinase CheA